MQIATALSLLFVCGGVATSLVQLNPTVLTATPKQDGGREVVELRWPDLSTGEREYEIQHQRWVVNDRHPNGGWVFFGAEILVPANTTIKLHNPRYGGMQRYRYRVRPDHPLMSPIPWSNWATVTIQN